MKNFKDFIIIISNVPERIYIDIMHYLLYICCLEILFLSIGRK